MKILFVMLISVGIVTIIGNNSIFGDANNSIVEPKPVKDWLAIHPNFTGCVHTDLKTGESHEITCLHPEITSMGLYEPQNNNATVLSPLKQFKENKDAYSVRCGQGLLLVVSKMNTPTCVKEATASKLWTRGWVSKSTDFYSKYATPDILEKFQSKIISNQKAIQIVQDYIKENNIELDVNTTSPGFKIITSLNYEVPKSNYNNLLDVDPNTGIPTQVMTPWTKYYKNPQWWAELEKDYLGMSSHRIEDGNIAWHVDYRECTQCIAPYPIFLVDAITGHVILTPNGIPSETPVKDKDKSSSPLKLSLSISDQYANPAQPLGIDVSLNNTGSTQFTLNSENNWPRDDLKSGLCSNLPFGISILKGYYDEKNMTSASSLVIYSTVPCPLPPKIQSYTFQPMSTNAIQKCDSLFSCTDPVDMKTHLEIPGFIDNNSQHKPFALGKYTIIAGDEWGHVAVQHFTEAYANALNANSLSNVCGQFYTTPGNIRQSNTVPVLLMNSNSTACARLTYTIISNYKDCNGQTCQNMVLLDSTLHIGNLHYEKHDNMFSVSSGKDYTNSFNITTIPHTINLDNYPIEANYTVTYLIKPLQNATGFYDQSIPKLACERYPLAVGYEADKVNASDFSYIDPLNPPCVASVDKLTRVEISGMAYKQVTPHP